MGETSLTRTGFSQEEPAANNKPSPPRGTGTFCVRPARGTPDPPRPAASFQTRAATSRNPATERLHRTPASPSNRGADQLLPAERGTRYRHRPPPAHSAGRGRGVGTVSSSRRRARYGRDGERKAGGGRYRSCGVRRKFAAALGGFHAAALPPPPPPPGWGAAA